MDKDKEIEKFNSKLNLTVWKPSETAVVASSASSAKKSQIYISDADYLRFLYRLYDHARIRFAAQQEFNLNPEAFRKAFGFKDKTEAIAEFFKLHQQLKQIYRLAEIFHFRLNSNGSIRVKFSIAEELDQSNYSVYPALVRQKQYSKNKIKHYKKSRDEIVDTYISNNWIGWGKIAPDPVTQK